MTEDQENATYYAAGLATAGLVLFIGGGVAGFFLCWLVSA